MPTTRIRFQPIPSLNHQDKTHLIGYYEAKGQKIASFMEKIEGQNKWRTLPVPEEFKKVPEDLDALKDMTLEYGFTLLEPRVIP